MINACVNISTVGLPNTIIDDIRPSFDLHDLQMLFIRNFFVEIKIVIMNYSSLRSHFKILLRLFRWTIYRLLRDDRFWILRFSSTFATIVRSLSSGLLKFKLSFVVNKLSSFFIYGVLSTLRIVYWITVFQIFPKVLWSLFSNFLKRGLCQIFAYKKLRVSFLVWWLEKLSRCLIDRGLMWLI